MFKSSLAAGVALVLAVLATATFGQSVRGGSDLAKFVPAKWMTRDGKAGVALDSVSNGIVTGKWFDVTGITYPIGATWVRDKVASGRFENGVFYMVTPPGNRFELSLSPDGSTLSGPRQVINNFMTEVQQVTFRRN